MKKLTIIDTFGFLSRFYFALPPLKNPDGFPTGLLTAFINFIDSLKKTNYLVFALDSEGKTFRHKIYSEYKANRGETPEDLLKQIEIVLKWIEKMGFISISKNEYEADDIIASISKIAKKEGMQVTIISHDKDLYQLIESEKVELFDAIKKKSIKEKECEEKFGVKPKDFTTFQSIVGDSADNILGVKGIGQKGAMTLVNKYSTLENIYKNLENEKPRTQKLLLESKDNAFLSLELVTLKDDLFKELNFEEFKLQNKNYLLPLKDEFLKYDMKQALKKIDYKKEQKKENFITLNSKDKIEEFLSNLPKKGTIAFDIETTSLNIKEAKLVGFSFYIKKGYYIPISHNYLGVEEQIELLYAIEVIKKLFNHKIVGHNLKFDLSILLYNYNILPPKEFEDTMILAWLDNPAQKVGLDALSLKIFDYEKIPFKSLIKKGEDFSTVNIEDATNYGGEDVLMTYKLYTHFKKQLPNSLLKLAKEVEYPFILVLMKMENIGIKIDRERLLEFKKSLEEKLKINTKEIYSLSGKEFNIRSTKQLGEVLFEELKLSGAKKTKTGYSTNEKVLETLLDKHPIIEKLLEFREYQKLLSTYIEPFIKLTKDENRIFTSFSQTGTTTGRLSSSNPNLQNIPIRKELGRQIREAFISKEGYSLVSIDYSQIELRLLAHFSQDKALLEAFKEGVDIHTSTAKKLFKEVTQENRSFAKSINFGILYGMGYKKLSNELKISSSEAKEIIKNYFNTFPTIDNFLEELQENIQTNEYIETILKRKRLFNFENINNMQKSAFLREATNTLFQGSTADLIKLSMNKIAKK